MDSIDGIPVNIEMEQIAPGLFEQNISSITPDDTPSFMNEFKDTTWINDVNTGIQSGDSSIGKNLAVAIAGVFGDYIMRSAYENATNVVESNTISQYLSKSKDIATNTLNYIKNTLPRIIVRDTVPKKLQLQENFVENYKDTSKQIIENMDNIEQSEKDALVEQINNVELSKQEQLQIAKKLKNKTSEIIQNITKNKIPGLVAGATGLGVTFADFARNVECDSNDKFLKEYIQVGTDYEKLMRIRKFKIIYGFASMGMLGRNATPEIKNILLKLNFVHRSMVECGGDDKKKLKLFGLSENTIDTYLNLKSKWGGELDSKSINRLMESMDTFLNNLKGMKITRQNVTLVEGGKYIYYSKREMDEPEIDLVTLVDIKQCMVQKFTDSKIFEANEASLFQIGSYDMLSLFQHMYYDNVQRRIAFKMREILDTTIYNTIYNKKTLQNVNRISAIIDYMRNLMYGERKNKIKKRMDVLRFNKGYFRRKKVQHYAFDFSGKFDSNDPSLRESLVGESLKMHNYIKDVDREDGNKLTNFINEMDELIQKSLEDSMDDLVEYVSNTGDELSNKYFKKWSNIHKAISENKVHDRLLFIKFCLLCILGGVDNAEFDTSEKKASKWVTLYNLSNCDNLFECRKSIYRNVMKEFGDGDSMTELVKRYETQLKNCEIQKIDKVYQTVYNLSDKNKNYKPKNLEYFETKYGEKEDDPNPLTGNEQDQYYSADEEFF